jgi:hypothetical protein
MGVTYHFLLEVTIITTSAITPALSFTTLDMNVNKQPLKPVVKPVLRTAKEKLLH